MGAFVTGLKTLLGGDPLKGIQGIIEEFHARPMTEAERQALELQRAQIEAARDQAITELQIKAITAETQSTDKYVSRARPTFLYVMIGAIGWSLLVAPIVNAFLHKGLVPMDIPGAYLELFGVAFLGYVGARTWEKTKGANK